MLAQGLHPPQGAHREPSGLARGTQQSSKLKRDRLLSWELRVRSGLSRLCLLLFNHQGLLASEAMKGPTLRPSHPPKDQELGWDVGEGCDSLFQR